MTTSHHTKPPTNAVTRWLRRIVAWWITIGESDEDKRLRAGMTNSEWYVQVQRPRSMREYGCSTVEEYDALLDSWRTKFDREWKEDQKARDERARGLWPKDKPYPGWWR